MTDSQNSPTEGENNKQPERESTKLKKKKMLIALKSKLGFVGKAAEAAGISRRTHEKWMIADAKYKAEVEDISMDTLEIVESKLLMNINAGSSSDIQFYLRKKGAAKGYADKNDLTVKQSVIISETKMFTGFDAVMEENLNLANNDAELNDARSQL